MRALRQRLGVAGLALLTFAPALGCKAHSGTPDAGPADAGYPYQPVSVASAVSKVKNLLSGLPATDAEIASVTANQGALPGLVGQWMQLPQYNAKMMSFFSTAFETSDVNQQDLQAQFNGAAPFPSEQAQIGENLQQMYARTALELIAEGKPFNQVMTTRGFMMTPALMALYADMDSLQTSDEGVTVDLFQTNTPASITLESATPIPIADSIDPTGQNFMHFYDPTLATQFDPMCPYGTFVYPSPATTRQLADIVLSHTPYMVTLPLPGTGNPYNCQPPPYSFAESDMLPTDFTDWQMISTRTPMPGEFITPFYDLPAFRAGNELVLNTVRVGFYTSIPFLAQWPTNLSNLARVTLNQTMIVGLNEPIDETNTTAPQSLAALDAVHAAPGTTCYACHQSLDPMRQFFRQAMTIVYTVQTDSPELDMPGQFAFHGVSTSSTGITDLGTQIANHPMFAAAWVQKLCTYANSAPCDPADPEFMRLVSVFVDSNFSWNALVQALFSSPIVTYLQKTATVAAEGETFPLSRREHLCAALSTRLNINDACGLDVNTVVPSDLLPVQVVAATWPSDQFSRGSALPVLANSPSLLMRSGLENICTALAVHLVDNTATGQFQSTNSTAAIQGFATGLMGLSSAEAPQFEAVLQGHFDKCERSGATPTAALQSTFVLACLSPSVTGIGQ